MLIRFLAPLALVLGLGPTMLPAQAPPAKPATPAKPAPDAVIFTNGDQLTGHLERASGGSIVFKSDMAGELTIGFDKIKELHSGGQFALLLQGEKVKRAHIEIGTVVVSGGNVVVTPQSPAPSPAPPAGVPTKQVAYLVDRDTFDRSVARRAGFTEGWNGSITAGATIVRSTQLENSYTAAATLTRAIPTVPFLPPRNRTAININESYGKQTSPVIPQTVPPSPPVIVYTNIFHADAERDEYFSPKAYALADSSFDHNYAQGLQLQQVYGIGAGWTPFKNDKQELDLKAQVNYEKQDFFSSTSPPPSTLEIIGSTFAETYTRHLPRKVVFTENANYIPAWNQMQAYAANGTATLSIPVFKRLSISITTTDNYLNDPSPGYKRNSYQFVTGITYNLK